MPLAVEASWARLTTALANVLWVHRFQANFDARFSATNSRTAWNGKVVGSVLVHGTVSRVKPPGVCGSGCWNLFLRIWESHFSLQCWVCWKFSGNAYEFSQHNFCMSEKCPLLRLVIYGAWGLNSFLTKVWTCQPLRCIFGPVSPNE